MQQVHDPSVGVHAQQAAHAQAAHAAAMQAGHSAAQQHAPHHPGVARAGGPPGLQDPAMAHARYQQQLYGGNTVPQHPNAAATSHGAPTGGAAQHPHPTAPSRGAGGGPALAGVVNALAAANAAANAAKTSYSSFLHQIDQSLKPYINAIMGPGESGQISGICQEERAEAVRERLEALILEAKEQGSRFFLARIDLILIRGICFWWKRRRGVGGKGGLETE